MSGVFVSVGTMIPFDRLVETMDEWAAANPDVPVEIQIGNGKLRPKFAAVATLMPPAEYRRKIAECQLFVAHAGMGSIISAIEAGKPLLMLPRLAAMGEHNNDHQLATAKNVANRPGLHVAADADDLKRRVSAMLADAGAAPAPISPYADPAFTARIRAFMEGQAG